MKFIKYPLAFLIPVALIFCIFWVKSFSWQAYDRPIERQLIKDRQRIATAPIPKFDKTVFLRNSFWFKDGQNSSGASAVLVEAEWGVAALTAKHLLGPAMGIEPAVKPSEFKAALNSWRVLIPGSSTHDVTLIADVADMKFPKQDGPSPDLLVFSVQQSPEELKTTKVQILKVSPHEPRDRDVHFLLGCPYAEADCLQNTYPITFLGSDPQLSYQRLDQFFDLSGFSGAPIVDGSGGLVGILTSSDGNTLFGERVTQVCVDKGAC
ncbi:MAG: hypothetical protein ACPGVN_08545 [Alphaproteobacteria bacterium]